MPWKLGTFASIQSRQPPSDVTAFGTFPVILTRQPPTEYTLATDPLTLARIWLGLGVSGPLTKWWDGDSEEPATITEWWDGSALQPVTVEGWWDGADVQPLA